MKKYFEFSGTISGTNLLLRNLLSSVIVVVCLSLTNTSFLDILALLIILGGLLGLVTHCKTIANEIKEMLEL